MSAETERAPARAGGRWRFTVLGTPTGRAIGLLVAVFVASRLVVLGLGFRYETGPLKIAIQSIDPHLMRTRLLQSLWHLHGQPPLWNALVGASLHVFPQHWPDAWHVAFFGLGLVEIVALFLLLVELGVSRRVAVAVAAAFMLTPPALAYENTFFYDYPSLVLLTVSALLAFRFVAAPTFVRGSLLFGVAASLVLLRTLFQLPWLIAAIALFLVACRGHRRLVLASSALPLALVLGVYAKNWVMYDVPSSSTWAGLGLARAAVESLPLSERRRLVAEGKLHNVSLVKPYSPLADYEAVGIKPAAPTGIPLLDEVSGPEFPVNVENRTYVEISKLYWKDDIWIIEHRPAAYLRAVRNALADFFSSPTRGWSGTGNVGKMRTYDRWFSALAYGRFGLGRPGLFPIAAYVFALVAGCSIALRKLRPGASPATVVVAFAALTIVYIGLLGNLAEVGENYRFRFVLDPLMVALVAVGLQRVRRRPASAAPR